MGFILLTGYLVALILFIFYLNELNRNLKRLAEATNKNFSLLMEDEQYLS